jgi:5-methylcytosine-specific restriction endonuclease McrA
MVIKNSGNGSVLDTRVLVLNRLFTAIKIITVRRAFKLLYKNTAEVVAQNNGSFATYDFIRWIDQPTNGSREDIIHTPNRKLKVPRVIRLLSYDKLPRQEVKFSRKSIMARDEYRCQYCNKKLAAAKLSIDHIIPRSRGGSSNWDNLVACCSKCNTKKGGKTPKEARMKLIHKPTPPTMTPLFSADLKDKKYTFWKEFVTEKTRINF